jgi:hypothetical protein
VLRSGHSAPLRAHNWERPGRNIYSLRFHSGPPNYYSYLLSKTKNFIRVQSHPCLCQISSLGYLLYSYSSIDPPSLVCRDCIRSLIVSMERKIRTWPSCGQERLCRAGRQPDIPPYICTYSRSDGQVFQATDKTHIASTRKMTDSGGPRAKKCLLLPRKSTAISPHQGMRGKFHAKFGFGSSRAS